MLNRLTQTPFQTLRATTRVILNSLKFAVENPGYVFVGITMAYAAAAKAAQTIIEVSCPDSNTLQTNINNNWRVDPEYCGNISPQTDFSLAATSNPLEMLSGQLSVYPDPIYCTQTPEVKINNSVILSIQNTQLACFGDVFNNAYIACRYPITYSQTQPTDSSVEILEDCDGNFRPWFPLENDHVGIFTFLFNSTQCNQKNATTALCQRDIAPSEMSALWQAQTQFPHINYNNIDNQLSASYRVNYNNSCCAIQVFGTAADLAIDENDDHRYDLTLSMDYSSTVLIANQSINCAGLLASLDAEYLTGVLGEVVFTVTNNSLAMSNTPYNDFCDVPTTLYKVQGGNFFYQDAGNNTYRFGSTFNTTLAQALAASVNQQCNLNLSMTDVVPVTAPVNRLNATDGCETELHAISMDDYSHNDKLNCTSAAFMAFANKDDFWPIWVCPPAPAQVPDVVFSSSSTGSGNTPADDSNHNDWTIPEIVATAVGGAVAVGTIFLGVRYRNEIYDKCSQKRRDERAAIVSDHTPRSDYGINTPSV